LNAYNTVLPKSDGRKTTMRQSFTSQYGWSKKAILNFLRRRFDSVSLHREKFDSSHQSFWEDYFVFDGARRFELLLSGKKKDFKIAGSACFRFLLKGDFGGKAPEIVNRFNSAKEVADAGVLDWGIQLFACIVTDMHGDSFNRQFFDFFTSAFQRDLDIFADILSDYGFKILPQETKTSAANIAGRAHVGPAAGDWYSSNTDERLLKARMEESLDPDQSGTVSSYSEAAEIRILTTSADFQGKSVIPGGWDKEAIIKFFNMRFPDVTYEAAGTSEETGERIEHFTFRRDYNGPYLNLILRFPTEQSQKVSLLIIQWMSKQAPLLPNEEEVLGNLNNSFEVSYIWRDDEYLSLLCAFECLKISDHYNEAFMHRYVDTYFRDLALTVEVVSNPATTAHFANSSDLPNFLRKLHLPDRRTAFGPALVLRHRKELTDKKFYSHDLSCADCGGNGRKFIGLRKCNVCQGTGAAQIEFVLS
jgi:hypothetical protein